MKSKKIISVIAAAVLAFGMTANAAGAMTIDEATAYALENSPTYKSAVAAAKASEYSAKSAVKMYNNYHDSDSVYSQMSISSFDLYLVRLGYVKNAAQLQMRVAQRASETAEYDLKSQVKNTFYTYLSTKEKVKIAEDNLKSAKERLAQAEVMKEKGMISEIAMRTFDLSVLQAESSLAAAMRTENQALITFKNTIGYSGTDELDVSGSFERNTEKLLTPEAVIAQLDKYSGVQSLNESLELAKERAMLAERWYFSSENEYWTEKYTYEQAQSDYTNSMNSIKLGVVQLYDSLMSIDEGMATMEKSLDLLKATLEAYELQYELGMVTAQDYVDKQQEYFNAQNQYMDLKLQEWILKLQYKAFYTNEQ